MNSQRYLCSHLVGLRNNSEESGANLVVNLEEIWKSGAVLESEEPIAKGARVEIRCESVFFTGDIVKVEAHDFGWRLEVAFSPMTPWTLEQFRPAHLLDIAALQPDKSG